MMVSESSRDSVGGAEVYVPSSNEVKMAIVSYMLLGLVAMMHRRDVSPYLSFHLSQAIGWRLMFVLVCVFSSVLLFVPYVRWLPLVVIVVMIGILLWMMYGAYQREFATDADKSLFAGVGYRFRGLISAEEFDSES